MSFKKFNLIIAFVHTSHFQFLGEKWQYVVLPKNPELTGVFGDTPMGTTGFATSGGHIYNHLSHPDGSVAWYHEIQSLDLSMGHSDPGSTYHYHGVRIIHEKLLRIKV